MPLSQVRPAEYDSLLQQKCAAVQQLMVPLKLPSPRVFKSAPTGFRMRAEFRVWHDGDDLNYVMFKPGAPREPIPITQFPIGCASIQAVMPRLIEALRGSDILRRKLFQVEFLSTLCGDTLITLIYHRPLDQHWENAAQSLQAELSVSLVGRSRKQKIILKRDYVTEELSVNGRVFQYRQYEQAFTQPNAKVNVHMLEWACEQAQHCSGNLLELYCGNGNFTLPLAGHFEEVIATELSKTSIKAARENLDLNQSENIQVIRLSAEEVTEAIAGTRQFRRLAELPKSLAEYQLNTVFVDPPRAGLDAQTLAMVAGFEHIIYISCNPQTLAENLGVLQNSHQARSFALFDQFPYTHHMECGVLLQRSQ